MTQSPSYGKQPRFGRFTPIAAEHRSAPIYGEIGLVGVDLAPGQAVIAEEPVFNSQRSVAAAACGAVGPMRHC